MDTLEYQRIDPISYSKSSIAFVIAAVLAGACGLMALGIGIYGAIAIFRGSPTSIGWMISSLATIGGAGLLVIQALAILRKSMEFTSVIGTLFSAIAFIVLPPIVEKILFTMSIPKINSTATWDQIGYMTVAGLIGGFIGAAYFLEVRRMRRDLDSRSVPEIHVSHKELPFIPPTETEPSAQ